MTDSASRSRQPLRLSRVIACAVFVLVPGCTGAEHETTPASTESHGFEVPKTPYSAFPYASQAQRRSFTSYVKCARRFGVTYEGPFADSRGRGALLRLASGTSASPRDRARVSQHCPQGIVALALTPDPSKSDQVFEHTLRRFTRCVNRHGMPDLRMPRFGEPNAYHGLRWPLSWRSSAMVTAANRCVDLLRDYIFAGDP